LIIKGRRRDEEAQAFRGSVVGGELRRTWQFRQWHVLTSIQEWMEDAGRQDRWGWFCNQAEEVFILHPCAEE
tara:strand:+ start:178 stop:393 length:216 start_codon:yes stop_codon:yes gene_type:complete